MDFSVFTKPLCRFLIHRYMGQYLKTELTSDQLEFHLADGTATVQGVMLNTEYINETLEASGIKIVSLVDGYVEELTVNVPWKKLLHDSTIIKVKGLQITLTPLANIDMTNTQELVSSFIGSIASSMDLAKSVIVDEQLSKETDSGGIEQFASIIDQIISRIKVIFENITVRVESLFEVSGLCTGIEAQIDKMEFLDEILEERIKNAVGAITEQPARLYTVTDMNKLLHVEGVRLYTDIWTPLKLNRLTNSQINSSDSEADSEMVPLNFQSCYSHLSSRSNSNTATRPQNSVPPNPILFAQLFSGKHTIRIRINNNTVLKQTDNSYFNKKIDIDICLGAPLYVFITSSQIVLLKNLLLLLIPKERTQQQCDPTVNGGLPMGREHFNRMMEQMQDELLESEKRQKFGSPMSAWSGSEQFYDFSEHANTDNNNKRHRMAREQLEDFQRHRTTSLNSEKGMGQKNHQTTASTSTLVERRPDIFTFSLRATSLVAVLTHDDPLSMESIKQYGESVNENIQSAINRMVERSGHFFRTAATSKLSKKKMSEQRALLSKLYQGDCLRLLANGFFASYSLSSDTQKNVMEVEGHLDECDFVEYLHSVQAGDGQHIDILCLSNVDREVSSRKNILTFRLKNTSEKDTDYHLDIEMESCKTELDPSIVDRIGNLLSLRPCFAKDLSHTTRVLDSEMTPLQDLNETMDSQPPVSLSIRCYCANWLLKLSIPMTDLSKNDNGNAFSQNFTQRRLHPEYFQFELEGAEMTLPKSLLADMYVHWTMNLRCKSAKGIFVGDSDFLECSKEQMTFLYAEAANAEKTMGNIYGIKLKLSFDKRNKSLNRILISDNIATSLSESIFNGNDKNRVEGPFSTKDTFHFKDVSDKTTTGSESSQKLIKAGTRKELMEFADECRSSSNFFIDVSVNHLNLALPSRKFFEVLYNRFTNDLALWEPKGPHYFQPNERKEGMREFIECNSAYAHFPESNESSSDDLEQTYSSTGSKLKRRIKCNRSESHQFSFGVHVDRACILLQKSNENHENSDTFASQLGIEFSNVDFFLVFGFRNDPNLSYIFTTSTNAELYHKNLLDENAKAFSGRVVNSQTFMHPKQKGDIYLDEISKDQNFELTDEDNFVISLRVQHRQENIKDILLAFGLRNSHLHVRPVEKVQLLWIAQFVDFFNVADYGVPGYIPPIINADLRVHFSNVLLGYDHSQIVKNSPYQIRLEIASSYISTRLMENIERLKFDCIFEDSTMWMRKKSPQSVKFDSQTRFYTPPNNFVKVVMADSTHFVLSYTLIISDQSPSPLIDFACANQDLAIWLCSDTIVEFLNVLKEIAYSDILKTFLESMKSKSHPDLPENETLFTKPADLFNDGIKRNVSVNDEDRLIRDMEAAMNDMPLVYPTNSQTRQTAETTVTQEMPPQLASSQNSDDKFIVIDKVPAGHGHKPDVGVTHIGNRFQTHFDSGGDFEFVTTELNLSSTVEGIFDELPLDLSSILISYKMKISSLTIYLFGGSDFASSARTMPHQKTFSQSDINRDMNALHEVDSKGGRCRDHTVFVEIKLTRLSTYCLIFDESSLDLSRFLLELGDFCIVDHLTISQINEMVHRLEIEGQPKSSAPFLKIYLKEDQLKEAILKISLAPIRLNIDQDTFEFLVDFKNEVAQGLRNVFDVPTTSQKSGDDVPVMELPKVPNNPPPTTAGVDKIYPDLVNANIYPDLMSATSISFSALKERDERGQKATNIADLFSEDDVDLNDSVYDEEKSSRDEETEAEPIQNEENADSQDAAAEDQSKVLLKRALAAKTTFIKDFTFSPACRLRVDYEAKNRIRTEGPFLAFLLGMTNLKKTELVLKEVRVEKGFLGFGRCAQYVVDEWQNDIVNRQFQNVVGGVAVINAIVQLAQGFKDLVAYPLEEYQKENGQLARGIQRGTSSFGLNAATAAIDATQRVVGLVQNIAELTFDVLNPNFVYQRSQQRMQIAGDLREGISMACNTVRESFVDTAQTLQTAAEQDRARGGWGMGILRHVTPTAIKPIVVASKATSHVLGGIKNQLKPEEHREEMRKWRHSAVGRQGVGTLRRQSSATQQQSTSSGSPSITRTTTYENMSPRKNW